MDTENSAHTKFDQKDAWAMFANATSDHGQVRDEYNPWEDRMWYVDRNLTKPATGTDKGKQKGGPSSRVAIEVEEDSDKEESDSFSEQASDFDLEDSNNSKDLVNKLVPKDVVESKGGGENIKVSARGEVEARLAIGSSDNKSENSSFGMFILYFMEHFTGQFSMEHRNYLAKPGNILHDHKLYMYHLVCSPDNAFVKEIE
ncbi:hypothetical protein LINPERHAP2_LOCUS25411 [Linum perenne]